VKTWSIVPKHGIFLIVLIANKVGSFTNKTVNMFLKLASLMLKFNLIFNHFFAFKAVSLFELPIVLIAHGEH